MSGELGMRLGKGNWTLPPARAEWQEGLPEGWTLAVKSRLQLVGMTVKAWQLETVMEIVTPSGATHQQLFLIMDKAEETVRVVGNGSPDAGGVPTGVGAEVRD